MRCFLIILLLLVLVLPACTGKRPGSEWAKCPACGYEFDVPMYSGG